MGKRIRIQRKNNGNTFKPKTTNKKGPAKLRPLDYHERHGVVRGVITDILHDPGRGAPLARIRFPNPIGKKNITTTVVAVEGLRTGQSVYFGKEARLAVGNCLPVAEVPEGCVITQVENEVGDLGKLAKASGRFATVISHSKEDETTTIKLPSGQKKVIHSRCRCIVGIIAASGRVDKPLLKAGNSYYKWKAKKKSWPVVRGVAKNPVDHPHGGGNHQHVGHPTTVSRHAPPGKKVGYIAARRTGKLRGTRVIVGGD